MDNNSFDNDTLHRINSAMRSLFRFAEFKNMNSPDIILDQEKKILKKHFDCLKPEEILFLAIKFNEYYIEESKHSEVQSINLVNEFENLIKQLN